MLLAKHNPSRAIVNSPQPLTQTPSSTLRRPSTANTFRGLVIPKVPQAPEPDECCMSGCAVCVHDLYQESLDAYRTSVASVRASLTAMKVPVEQWPETIRPKPEGRTQLPASSVSLNAFEEMERALKARRQAEAQTMDVHPNHLRKNTSQGARKQRWRWKGIDLGALYEGLRWVLFSNR